MRDVIIRKKRLALVDKEGQLGGATWEKFCKTR
jgi:hypothetical protein